jgi:tetratricopeptide (TPR) repeat protein
MDSLSLALKHQEMAARGFETFLGPESHFYALAMYNQAKIHDKLGQHVEQGEQIKKAMLILAQLYGTQNRNYGKCMIALAGALRKQGLPAEAMDTLRQAQKMADRIALPVLQAEALLEQARVQLDQEQGSAALQSAEQAQDLLTKRPEQNALYLGLARFAAGPGLRPAREYGPGPNPLGAGPEAVC